MGLDSIELVMDVEKYFNIRIPDPEAEKILTVQNMVDCVAQLLNITTINYSLRDEIFARVSDCIRQLTESDTQFQLTDVVTNYFSTEDDIEWQILETHLDLNVPRFNTYHPKSNKYSDKFKKLINWTPFYDWKAISFEQFIDAICAGNYQKLLDRDKITGKYEIYIVVMGITVDKIGVDYYEISPDKSFINDLGVD